MLHLVEGLTTRIFIFIAAGVLAGKLAGKKGEPAARLFITFALYVLIPVFVLVTLWTSPLSVTASWKVAASAVAVMAFCAGLALGWARLSGAAFRDIALPVVFMNSAYLAIPVCALLWGADGIAYALIYNVAVTLAHFTLGVWWVSERRSVGEVMGLPIVYATIAGLALNIVNPHPLPGVREAGNLISQVTLPVMLIFMGYRLGGLRVHTVRRALVGVALRMGGGWLAALCAVRLLGIEGTAAGVCIIASVMPAAVNSYILAEHFGADAEFAAAAVSLGTVLALAVVPAVSSLLP